MQWNRLEEEQKRDDLKSNTLVGSLLFPWVSQRPQEQEENRSSSLIWKCSFPHPFSGTSVWRYNQSKVRRACFDTEDIVMTLLSVCYLLKLREGHLEHGQKLQWWPPLWHLLGKIPPASLKSGSGVRIEELGVWGTDRKLRTAAFVEVSTVTLDILPGIKKRSVSTENRWLY